MSKREISKHRNKQIQRVSNKKSGWKRERTNLEPTYERRHSVRDKQKKTKGHVNLEENLYK